MGTDIEHIEYCLPEEVLSNDQIEKEFASWSSGKIEKKTGVRERHIAAENETALDLGKKAGEKLLDSIGQVNIGMLLFCTQSPDYYIPPTSAVLHKQLGLPCSTGALDFNLGCSGFIYGLAMAHGYIQSGQTDHVLLILAETYSKYINPRDKSNRTIFGDAAAAVLISHSAENHIGRFALGTDGSGYANLIVPNGGLRTRYDPKAVFDDDGTGCGRTANDLYMNGPEIFNFTIQAVPRVVEQVLEKNRLSLEDIDYVIFHQANKYIIEYLRKKLGIARDRFFIDLLHTGNTVSCTIPIGLKQSMENGTVGPGSRVLLVGFGVGYSWGATILDVGGK